MAKHLPYPHLPKRMIERHAAEYLGLRPTTLARWRLYRRGPKWFLTGTREVSYLVEELDWWRDNMMVDNQRIKV